MSLVLFPRQFLVDINGTPRVGAKASFYQAGTDTLITVYTTPDFSQEHTNPVLSVGGGFFPAIYIDHEDHSTYKLVVTDPVNAEIYNNDNIPTTAPLVEADLVQLLHQRTQAEFDASVTPSDYSIPSHDTTGEVNPARYGYVGDGVANDWTSIQDAAAVINQLGGGTLRFPPDTTPLIYTGSQTGNLCEFEDCVGVSVLGYGVTLTVDLGRVITGSLGICFSFVNCKNIFVDGFTTNGPTLDVSNSTVKGVEFVRCQQGCKNIKLGVNRIVNWLSGFIASKDVADPESYRSQNIEIGVLDVVNCWYGINNQRSGDNMVVHCLRTDTVHRSAFIYGASHYSLNVWSKNHKSEDVLALAYDGGTSENIKINYHSASDANACGAANKVVVGVWGTTASKIRDVDVRTMVDYPSSNSGAAAVVLTKRDASFNGDATDRGHRFENIKIGGNIQGTPSQNNGGVVITDNNATFGTGEFGKNISLEDLTIFKNSGAGNNQVYMTLGFVTDVVTLKNVVSDERVIIRQDSNASGRRIPYTAKLELVNVTCLNRFALSGDAEGVPLDNIRAGTSPLAVQTGWCNGKTLTISATGADHTWQLPAATVGLCVRFVNDTTASRLNIDPNGSEVIRGGGAGKMYFSDSDFAIAELECFTAGTWEIVNNFGTWAFEP